MMRQKLLKLFIVLSMILVPSVKAACTYKEQADLNKEVANIKVNYEVTTKTMQALEPNEGDVVDLKYEMFKVNILNLSDNFYIEYTNNANNDKKTFYSSDALNGIISFDWEDLSKVTTMTFKVYTSSKTNCKGELSRTIYLTLPRYNPYSAWSICDDHEELSVCDQYVSFDDMTYSEFLDKLDVKANNNGTNNNNTNTASQDSSISSNNIYTYIGIGTACLLIVIVAVVLINKKRNRL